MTTGLVFSSCHRIKHQKKDFPIYSANDDLVLPIKSIGYRRVLARQSRLIRGAKLLKAGLYAQI